MTKYSPFFANHDRNLNLFLKSRDHSEINTVIIQADKLKQVHNNLTINIFKINEISTKNVNKKRKIAPQLKKRNKVYLLTKNL